jgi:hypothetical protein
MLSFSFVSLCYADVMKQCLELLNLNHRFHSFNSLKSIIYVINKYHTSASFKMAFHLQCSRNIIRIYKIWEHILVDTCEI